MPPTFFSSDVVSSYLTDGPTGFTGDESNSRIEWNDVTYTLTLSPTGASFDYYIDGRRYVVSSPLTAAITPAQVGNWFFYLTSTGTLAAAYGPTYSGDLFSLALVAIIAWTGSEAIMISDERHGVVMNKTVHRYLHYHLGCQINSAGGFAVTPGVAEMAAFDGSAAYHTKLKITGGNVIDEDLERAVAHKDVPVFSSSPYDRFKQHLGVTSTVQNYVHGTKTVTLSEAHSWRNLQPVSIFTAGGVLRHEDTIAGDVSNSANVVLTVGNAAIVATDVWKTYATIPVLYRTGTGTWNRKALGAATDDNPIIAGVARPRWNQLSGGTWSLVDATDKYHFAIWLLAATNTQFPIVAILGQREDKKLTDAQSNNTYEGLSLTPLPAYEMKILYRLIYQCDDGYGNAIKARLVHISDERGVRNIPAGSYNPESHASLTNLTYGLAGHIGFARLPFTSAGAPGVNNDEDDTAAVGFYVRIGDMWIDTAAAKLYVCTDPSATAAVWKEIAFV